MKIDGDKQCWQGGHFISFRHDYNVKEQRSGGGGGAQEGIGGYLLKMFLQKMLMVGIDFKYCNCHVKLIGFQNHMSAILVIT